MAITLNNGLKMPMIGLGVWRTEGKDLKNLMINAIKIGYRHFDCAADYKNEAEVGEALEEALQTGLVKREDLFITTKLWNSDHGHVVEACKDSLNKLRLQYLDLYLVHFPVATNHTGHLFLPSFIFTFSMLAKVDPKDRWGSTVLFASLCLSSLCLC
ncbi:reductase [Lithospermum erythrorhizon]|uniref:Reductase n=1 Tax=Lithospermum erythrorhizon TaxID=34254 RepID=A0AAV3R2K7_LITER